MNKTNPFSVCKRNVLETWQRVKENRGSAGVDKVTILAFEQNLEKNLYKI